MAKPIKLSDIVDTKPIGPVPISEAERGRIMFAIAKEHRKIGEGEKINWRPLPEFEPLVR